MTNDNSPLISTIRLATVTEVDAKNALCRVMMQASETHWLPWLTFAGEKVKLWRAPEVDERVLVLLPDSSPAGAVVLTGIYTKTNPSPAQDKNKTSLHFGDGSVIEYDQASHALNATLAAGATATITADGGITLNGDVTVNGSITASGDVADGERSIKNFYAEYKKHIHDTPQGPTGPPK